MPIKGIILLFVIAVIIAWFGKDEIFAWIKGQSSDKSDDNDEDNE